jgi:hypothetical protein
VRLLEKDPRRDDPEPKAVACYGIYVPELQRTWIRFMDGRPVSSITTQFLDYCIQKLAAAGKEGHKAMRSEIGSPLTTGRSKPLGAECG